MDRAFLFEMQLSFSIEEIASITKPENRTGRSAEQIRKISSLQDARPGDLSFLSNLKYRKQVESSEASLVFVPADFKGEPRDNQVYFFLKNPSLALARICEEIEQQLRPRPKPGIHPSAVIDETARIAESAAIGPLCIVEKGAVIGERVVLQGQVFIGRTEIGRASW